MHGLLVLMLTVAASGWGAQPTWTDSGGIEALATYNRGEDYSRARHLAESAAEQGDAVAQFVLGRLYEHGIVFRQTYGYAVSLYQRAAEQHYAPAQAALGSLYERGLGVALDYDKAFSLYMQAAEQGDARGQDLLGNMYCSGVEEVGLSHTTRLVMHKDLGVAAKWYRKAAEQGDAQAQRHLGNLILWGALPGHDEHEPSAAQFRPGPELGDTAVSLSSRMEAVRWLAKAAIQRDTAAIKSLFRLLAFLFSGVLLIIFLVFIGSRRGKGDRPTEEAPSGETLESVDPDPRLTLASLAPLYGKAVLVISAMVCAALAILYLGMNLGVLISAALLWAVYREVAGAEESAEPSAESSAMPLPDTAVQEVPSQETRTSVGAPTPASGAAPAPVLGSALIGKKYEMVHRIGEGGMGLVYAGRDFELGRFVAIKKMRPELKLSAREKKRFLREAKLSAALHHPCIVEIYDIAEQDGEVYLIFEYVDGQTLDKRLDSGPMAAGELKPALKYVCQALEFAHSKKVIHRDLKPSNIMVTRSGFAKVMDFGIAREIKDTMSRLTRLDTSGTLGYMAPEQELGKFDGRSDLYALGVTLYEALAGALPFPGPNFMRQKELMQFQPLAEAAPQAPKEFRDAIERCLRYDPKERFQSVPEFAQSAGVGSS